MEADNAADPDDRLKALAARQWRDYQRVSPGSAFADPQLSLTLEEAYTVQREVARLRCVGGDAVIGYKVGCIGPGIKEQFGMSGPIHACLFRSELRHSDQMLRRGSYANLAIEGEMALRIGADGAIVAAFPVIELHHFVFRAPRKTLAELVANNGINAGAVLPKESATTPLARWTNAHTLSVAINGTVVDAGALWAMPGGPVEALDWLKDDLGRFGAALKPGDLILAGTPLGLYPVRPGDHVVVSVDSKEQVGCHIV
jgi:2-keto-4-pentenoate hydratase